MTSYIDTAAQMRHTLGEFMPLEQHSNLIGDPTRVQVYHRSAFINAVATIYPVTPIRTSHSIIVRVEQFEYELSTAQYFILPSQAGGDTLDDSNSHRINHTDGSHHIRIGRAGNDQLLLQQSGYSGALDVLIHEERYSGGHLSDRLEAALSLPPRQIVLYRRLNTRPEPPTNVRYDGNNNFQNLGEWGLTDPGGASALWLAFSQSHYDYQLRQWLVSDFSVAAGTGGFETQFSADGISWHNDQETSDRYVRHRLTNGQWLLQRLDQAHDNWFLLMQYRKVADDTDARQFDLGSSISFQNFKFLNFSWQYGSSEERQEVLWPTHSLFGSTTDTDAWEYGSCLAPSFASGLLFTQSSIYTRDYTVQSGPDNWQEVKVKFVRNSTDEANSFRKLRLWGWTSSGLGTITVRGY